MIRVTINDVRAAHLCTRGAREFFIRENLDWREFLRDGLPISVFEVIDDEQVRSVCDAARLRCGVDNG